MINFLLKLIGDPNEKKVKKISGIIDHINALEPEFEKLSDEELRAKTDEFKAILAKRPTSDNAKADRILEKEALDKILPEAFATVREAGKRVLNMRHFDVQLIGAYFLHNGHIAEMRTGEGKTLVATLAAYLNALTGKGVHVVTVNDYLAKRDSEWMGKIYKFLGLSVGVILSNQHDADEFNRKRAAYACDITYGTNNEFGFDYLRDNMVIYKNQLVQRGLHYAIVDEIDSILIDEARTPLIISGRANESSDLYKKANDFVRRLEPKVIIEEDVKDFEQAEDNEKYDYIVDLKAKSASLTQKGIKKAEEFFGLENFNDLENSTLVHHVNQALRAHGIMKKDIDYIVKDGEVLIVDEFTGRIMYGRRYNNGLHQAIEAKERVKIADESKTLATITFQNYFRMYDKLSGMTGTAMTEEAEFEEIYNLDVVSIPTNKPMVRKDENDVIYKNENAKFRAVIESVKESHAKGQPVLIGTVSIEKSEKLSKLLNEARIPHEVLNAKSHEKEAMIVAQAGKYGAVTIATNMAGRGTDIMLGGNSEYLAKEEMRKNRVPEYLIEESNTYYETDDQDILRAREQFNKLVEKYEEQIKEEKQKVIDAGGLKIIGTERHESRRIDNQLRGRSGRQGDVGESKFYIGLDDDLMKIFGGDAITRVYNTLGADENMPIQSRMISKAVENAQKKVEGRNFSIRKNVLKYDDVMNVQREIIYNQRREVLDGKDIHENIVNMITTIAEETVSTYIEGEDGKAVNAESLNTEISNIFGIDMAEFINTHEKDSNAIIEELEKQAIEKYQAKEEEITSEKMRELERVVMLKVVDQKWMDHIDNMDELKNGIGLRAYGQKDPVVQYRIEGFEMFDEMIEDIKNEVTKIMLHIRKKEGVTRTNTAEITNASLEDAAINLVDGNLSEKEGGMNKTVVNEGPKVGRNDPCPCGSGKKYKNCCGK